MKKFLLLATTLSVLFIYQVNYDVVGFLDKNKDKLFKDLSQAMFACERAMLKQLFPEGDPDAANLKRPSTTGHQFKVSPLSFVHSLAYSLTHSLTRLPTHSHTHSHTHSLTCLLTHSLFHSLTHPLSLTHSLFHSLTYSSTSLSLTH